MVLVILGMGINTYVNFEFDVTLGVMLQRGMFVLGVNNGDNLSKFIISAGANSSSISEIISPDDSLGAGGGSVGLHVINGVK